MKVKLNPMFEQVSGQLGEIVFRELRGKTVVSRKALTTSIPSEEQVEHRQRFKMAAAYGRSALDVEASRDRYEAAAKERDLPIFAVMIADYFNVPVIHNVDLSAYNGQISEEIAVTVTDDFAVATVHVKISDAQGNVLESGLAENMGGVSRWVYRATTHVTVPVTVEVTAKDHPGGLAVQTANKSLSPS